MGFNKRIVDENLIYDFLEGKQNLQDIFKSDAIILMDNIASETFKLHQKKIDETNIKKILNEKYGHTSKKTSIG
jgi:hypothetical protein